MRPETVLFGITAQQYNLVNDQGFGLGAGRHQRTMAGHPNLVTRTETACLVCQRIKGSVIRTKRDAFPAIIGNFPGQGHVFFLKCRTCRHQHSRSQDRSKLARHGANSGFHYRSPVLVRFPAVTKPYVLR